MRPRPQIGEGLTGLVFQTKDWQASVMHRRLIYSDSFLAMDSFAHAVGKEKDRIADPDRFAQQFRQTYEREGLHGLFLDDIQKFVCCVETKQNLDLLGQVVKAVVSDNRRDPKVVHQRIKAYLRLCLRLDADLEAARSLWNDPAFYQSGFKRHHCTLHLLYYVILYRNQCYQELVDEVLPRLMDEESQMQPGETVLQATLAIAALAKIRTPDSLALVRKVNKAAVRKGWQGGGRARLIYAFLAHKSGEHGEAHDLLDLDRPKSSLVNNLLISILTAAQRVDEAFGVLDKDVLADGNHFRRVLSKEVMTSLADAVVDDPVLSDKFADICVQLDEKATMTDETLEEMIFEPINRSKHKPTSRPRTRSENRREF